MNTWVAVNNAVLTQSFPDTAAAPGVRGDRLPDSSRLTGSFSIQQDFRITQYLNGFLGGSVSYISSKEGEFVSSGSRPVYPAYAKLDLHFGLSKGPWNINLFANNVTDRRGIVSGGTYPPYAFVYIQPRSLGIGLTRSF
jgi:iron complex outermembrane receptor protein